MHVEKIIGALIGITVRSSLNTDNFIHITHNRYATVHPRKLVSVSWWRHQMETFSALLVICVGIHRSPVNSPHKGQWRGDLMFSLIGCLNKRLSKHRNTSDLRHHRAHYDVNVMVSLISTIVTIVLNAIAYNNSSCFDEIQLYTTLIATTQIFFRGAENAIQTFTATCV